MRNLKILDLLASIVASGAAPVDRGWVGESDLIRWYWENIIRQGSEGASRAALLEHLAIQEADTGDFEATESSLSRDQLATVQTLSGVLATDPARETVSFVHDLLSDWARFRVILGQQGSIGSFVESHAKNPRWQRAIRLYGVALLEQDTSGRTWHEALQETRAPRDLFLEALVFAGNSEELITYVWPILTAEHGRLLTDLLKRFRHVASIPNPSMVTIARHMKIDDMVAATWDRLPLWMYWLPMIRCLRSHLADAVHLVPSIAAYISRAWLHFADRNWPGRQEAADIALAVAWQAFRSKPYYHDEEEGRTPYVAAFEAFRDRPGEVRAFALKAAARVPPSADDGEAYKDYLPPGTVISGSVDSILGEQQILDPWPNGPLYRIHEPFKRACLDTDCLRTAMQENPTFAKEIILATLISVRPPKSAYGNADGMLLPDVRLGMDDDPSFWPQFYTRGPFLLFLNTSPKLAIETIVDLVDFATERWIEAEKDRWAPGTEIELVLGMGSRVFVGGFQVYHWYHGVSRSNVISSALMALEKWLYDAIRTEENAEEWIQLVLDRAKSVAFIGLLSEVGRFAPELFLSILRPLLLVPATYFYETMHQIGGGNM
jgi:hypothetical protein